MRLGLDRRGVRAVAVAIAVAGVGAAATSGCKTAATTPPGPWPEDPTSGERDDFSNVHLLENVVQATPEQNDKVIVQPDRLVFPASAAREVKEKWPVGAPIVGGRRQGTAGNNAFGYLRKVKEVKTEGDTVVVLTEQATLLDVLDKSQIQASSDPRAATPVNTTGMSPEELAALFPDVESGDGASLEDANASGNKAPGAVGVGTQRVGSAQAQRWNPFARLTEPGLRTRQIDGDYSAINLWAEFDATATFNLPASDGEGSGSLKFLDGWTQSFTVSEGGKTATFDVRASATLKSSMYFKPRLKVYLDVDIGKKGPYLDELTASLSGPLNLKNTLDLDVSVTGQGVDLVDLPHFFDLLRAKLPIAKTPGKRLAKSRPIVGPSIGPVPTAYVASLWLDCSVSVPNSIAATATFNVDAQSIGGGIKYTDAKGWSYDDLMKPIRADGNIVVRSGGSVAFECAVTPKISWLIGGVGGPTAAVRTSVRGTATGKPECDPKAKKSGPADLKSTLNVVGDATLQAEGTIDVLKLNYTIATINLFTYPKPAFQIFSRNDTFPGQGGGRCQSPCDDKQKSAGESDVDCGGAVCDGCAPGKACAANGDCRSGICKPNGTCGAGPCDNGVKDGSETGVDCGGACPAKCGEGTTCTKDADCGSGICNVGGYCVAYLCLDGRLNGSESDVDCPCIVPGGYALCADGKACRSAADCQSNLCNLTTHTCAADLCSDGVVSGNETDVDCGGSCSWKCATGASCKVGADCQNGICNATTKKCAANACGDGIKNNQETGVDCGGPTCAKCGLGERCADANDCVSGICNRARGVCGANACSDGVLSPGESGIDCGGTTCAKCSIGNSCNTNADCISAYCNATTHRCVGSACEDGVKNNNYCTGGFCTDLPPPSPSNCREWYARLKVPGTAVPSGRYKIAYAPHVSTHPRNDVTVWCDMSDTGIDNSGRGGWTLIGEHNSAIALNESWPLVAGWFLGQNSANITFYSPEEFSALFTDYRRHDVQLMRIHWTEMRWAAYYNGTRNYLSRAIPRSDIRLAPSNTVTPYPANLPVMDMLKGGWIIFGPQSTSGYFWCAGDNLFTDGGQVSGPYDSFPITGNTSPPPGCKSHTTLNIGYDFSESGFPNQGLTFAGAGCPPLVGANQSYLNCYPANAPTPNMMTGTYGGTQIVGSTTRTDVGVHAVWAY